jgi:hypothetical protein
VRTVFEEFNGVLFSVHFVFSPWMGIGRHALIAKLKIFCSYTLMFRMLLIPPALSGRVGDWDWLVGQVRRYANCI